MSRVLQPFEYYEPATIAEALNLAAAPGAKLLAGGCDLVPAMRCGRERPGRVVSIMKVEGLDDMTLSTQQGLRIGARTTIKALTECFWRNAWDALRDAIEQFQPAHICNMGTLVGNVCSAVPFADLPVALAALGAEVGITDGIGARTVPIEAFYPGPQTTALRAGELASSLFLPTASPNSGSAFAKIYKAPRRGGDLHKINAACSVTLDPQAEQVVAATVVVGCCSFQPQRMAEVEAFLQGAPATTLTYKRAGEIAAKSIAPMTNAPWLEEMRGAFVRALVGDCLELAARRARVARPGAAEGQSQQRIVRPETTLSGAALAHGNGAALALRQIATFRVNGRDRQAVIEPHMLLVDVIRDQIGLTGTKRACATGHCGACSVLIDGVPIRSCITLAIRATATPITTVEGLADPGGALHPLQQAFIDHAASQCGYCTAGMLIAAKALLAANPRPTREEITRGIGGNICRCTGYIKIIDAVLDAAHRPAVALEVRP